MCRIVKYFIIGSSRSVIPRCVFVTPNILTIVLMLSFSFSTQHKQSTDWWFYRGTANWGFDDRPELCAASPPCAGLSYTTIAWRFFCTQLAVGPLKVGVTGGSAADAHQCLTLAAQSSFLISVCLSYQSKLCISPCWIFFLGYCSIKRDFQDGLAFGFKCVQQKCL